MFLQEGDLVHSGSNANYRAYTDDEGRDWLALSNLDLEAAGAYKCNYKYPDKQVFSMKFQVMVRFKVLTILWSSSFVLLFYFILVIIFLSLVWFKTQNNVIYICKLYADVLTTLTFSEYN